MDSLIGSGRRAAQLSFVPQGHKFRSSRRAAQLSFILLLALAFTGQANQSGAEEYTAEPWALEANQITYHTNPQQITAEGDVVLRHTEEQSAKPLEIRADTVTYLTTGSVLDARGNVFLKEESGTISASSILLNLQDQTGKLTSTTVSLADHEIKFSGERVEKIASDRYVFFGGKATSCQTDGNKSPAWSINWRKADITINGMAYLKHATFKVKKVPLLYIPYLALPAKTTRQTGFLFPEISHSSRDGIGFTTPLFINLSPSSDLTFFPGYYEKRGTFAGLEFRSVSDYNSRTTLAINYLDDRTKDPGPPASPDDYRQDGYLRAEHDRYWVRGKADHYFSQNSVLRLDVDAVSDQDFLHEYRDGISGFSQSNRNFLNDFKRSLQEASLNFRESILQLSRRGQLGSGGLEVRYVDDPLAKLTGTEPAQTLPRALYSTRLPLLNNLPLSLGWDSEYVYYRPEEGIGYQRLDLLPRLIMPMPFGALIEGTIAGGFRETAYRVETIGTPTSGWNSTNAKNRNTWDFTTNMATLLSRDFLITAERRLTHTFRPNLRYNYRTSTDQSELPNLDGFDRLADDNSLTLELNNYFRSGNADPKILPNRQLGYLKLKQSYNLQEARRDLTRPGDKRRPFSDLALDLEISPLTNLFFRYQTALDVYGQGVGRYNLQGRYHNSRQDRLTIDYDYVKGVATNLNISTQLQLTDKLSARYNTSRSLLDNHATAETIGLLYNSQCWGVELTSSRDSEDRRVMLTFSLTGIGKALELRKSEI
ncbi:MAG: LPS assembly protein LptD [Thermodesulfobacteriota bacterium]